jgi:hypothetical protein
VEEADKQNIVDIKDFHQQDIFSRTSGTLMLFVSRKLKDVKPS